MTTPGPAGWYEDPHNPNALRYWDGQGWTQRLKQKTVRQPLPHPVAPPPPPFPGEETPGLGLPDVRRRGSATSSTVTIGAIGAIALLSIAGFFGYKSLFAKSDEHQTVANSGSGQISGNSGSGPNFGGADEVQIRQLVQVWTDDFNNRDLAGMQSLMCSGSQIPRNPFELLDKVGKFTNTVINIVVTGDRATATVTSTWSSAWSTGGERFDNSYAKENGTWKICQTANY